MKVKLLSRVRLVATPWTAAYQVPPPTGFSRQEYWSGVPLPRLKPASLLGWIAAADVYGLSSVPLRIVAHSIARLLLLKCSTFTPLVKASQCLPFTDILSVLKF